MLIAVTSAEAGAGKTGVASAIARHYAYSGQTTRLVRAGAADETAANDAAWYGSLFFAPGSPASPVTELPADDASSVTVVECSVDEAKALAAAGAKVVVVSRGKAAPIKDITPAATIVTNASVASDSMIALPSDRILNSFSVSEAQALISADILVAGDRGDPTCDSLVIAPISADAGHTYFRRFSAMAVVVRFDKTDMHLAAMAAEPECLILTGGRRPSDYLFDAANARGIPVLLSRTDTENTVIALESVFDRTRFQGERKLERMAELLEPTNLYAALS